MNEQVHLVGMFSTNFLKKKVERSCHMARHLGFPMESKFRSCSKYTFTLHPNKLKMVADRPSDFSLDHIQGYLLKKLRLLKPREVACRPSSMHLRVRLIPSSCIEWMRKLRCHCCMTILSMIMSMNWSLPVRQSLLRLALHLTLTAEYPQMALEWKNTILKISQSPCHLPWDGTGV